MAHLPLLSHFCTITLQWRKRERESRKSGKVWNLCRTNLVYHTNGQKPLVCSMLFQSTGELSENQAHPKSINIVISQLIFYLKYSNKTHKIAKTIDNILM
jgi:hypothetical protein